MPSAEKKEIKTTKPTKLLKSTFLYFFNLCRIEHSLYIIAKSLNRSKAKSYMLRIPKIGTAIKKFAATTTSSCCDVDIILIRELLQCLSLRVYLSTIRLKGCTITSLVCDVTTQAVQSVHSET